MAKGGVKIFYDPVHLSFGKEGDIDEPLRQVNISPAPVIIEEKEYDKMSTHINHLLSHIPNDLLRFDCAEMEQPLEGLLYENNEWAKQTPSGNISHQKEKQK